MNTKTINCACFSVLLASAASAAAQGTTPLKVETLFLDQAIAEVSRDQAALPALYNTVKDIYLRQGKNDKALSLLDTYYRNRGTDQALLTGLASLYEQAGAAARAVEVYEKLLSLDSGTASYINSLLSALYLREGNFEKAREITESQLKREPGNLGLLQQFAGIQQSRQDWYGAEETLKKIIELQPQSAHYQHLSQVYLGQKRPDKALDILEEGMKKLPSQEVPLGMMLSELLVKNGDKDKALRVLNDILWKVGDPVQKDNIRQLVKNIENSSQQTTDYIPPAGPGRK